MPVRVCRWGILGTATIARKFWQSVRLADNAHLMAVASRDVVKARQFVNECQSRFPVQPETVAIGGYQEMLERPDIDAVYIPLPTGVRKEWVEAAAGQGKHVLCEKPCGMSLDALRQSTDCCSRAGVQFMDNVMFMHSRRLQAVLDVIHDRETFGDLRRISSQFSFPAPDEFFRGNIRSQNSLEPWGALGDLGWYNIRIALLAMENELPVSVTGRAWSGGKSSEPFRDGLPPAEFTGELHFAGDVTASLYCSFVGTNQQWVHFTGTRRSLRMDDFALGAFGNRCGWTEDQPDFNRSGWDFNYEMRPEQHHVDEYSNGHGSSQEVQLVRTFSNLVLAGRPDPAWPLHALRTQAVMDALTESAKQAGKSIRLTERFGAQA
jgi:predicted dehydrogenase